MLGYDWWCMVINISVKYNGGLLREVWYHLNVFYAQKVLVCFDMYYL